MLARETQPYVLLDDARAGGTARLYRRPVRVVATRDLAAVAPLLAEVRAGVAGGLHAAGFLGYAAGTAFEPTAPASRDDGLPLLWFALFDAVEAVADVPALLPDAAGGWAGVPAPRVDYPAYATAFDRVQALIAAGDIYQANVTFRADVPVAGHPLALYARLRAVSGAGWGAVVATGDATILSLSPELFFASDGGRLTCRPMKGTARRGATAVEDDALAAALAADPKQRAENLMIVDLMRNDLSRVAVAGSVRVPDLFAVERYPTVLQMTSTVTADLAPGRDAVDVLAAMAPCGSITGAPKIRAMQAIAEVEADGRGLYTGNIGYLAPGGDAQFSVAIRTLVIDATKPDHAVLGLGSGIVADSRVRDEWEECHAKAAFVTAGQRRFDLIETMAFDPEAGMPLLERHLARMKDSADAFGFAFDRHAARNELQAATFRLRAHHRVRVLASRHGSIAIEVAPMPPAFAAPVDVAVVPLPVDPADWRLRHKTSDRGFYDAARIAAGTGEVVFVAPDGTLTEGSFTTLFVDRGDGVLVTPPVAQGLLPGILRAALIAEGRAVEGVVRPDDLGDGFFLGNALRGLFPARLRLPNA